MSDCKPTCNDQAYTNLAAALKQCPHGPIVVEGCHIDDDIKNALLGRDYHDTDISFSNVTGTLDLQGAKLHALTVHSSLSDLNITETSISHITVSPGGMPQDAYNSSFAEPKRIKIGTVNAYGARATVFELRQVEAVSVKAAHLHIEDTLDLSWLKVEEDISLPFTTASFLEAPQVQAGEMNLFGSKLVQASLQYGVFDKVELTTASIERALNISHALVKHDLSAFKLAAGTLDISDTSATALSFGYASIDLLVLGDDKVLRAPDANATVVSGPGLKVGALRGGIDKLTQALAAKPGNQSSLWSLEATVRKDGDPVAANAIAYAADSPRAILAGKIPAAGATGVAVLFVLCAIAAVVCCVPRKADRSTSVGQRIMCALDIVLPDIIDLGALKAWSDYDDPDKTSSLVRIRPRTFAFLLRLMGTVLVGYLLLYITTLRS